MSAPASTLSLVRILPPSLLPPPLHPQVTLPPLSSHILLQTWLLSLRLAIVPVFLWLCVYSRRRPRSMGLGSSLGFVATMGALLPLLLLVGWQVRAPLD